ncbi:MAG: hypothetical protein IPL53_14135 [Ignavibacteria bacterium]|nr:hypothetical protein [Ignavibacteria bacterium]
MESGNFFRISDFFQNERGTNNKIVSSIFTDTTGVILIGAPGEEAFYELAKDKYGCIAFSKCRELKSSNPEKEKLIERSKCIAIFKIGDAVWYIANKSIFEFNLNTQSLKIYSHSMFSEYAVLHENKLIIGSTGGNIVFFDLIEKKFIDLKTKYSNLLNGFKNSSYVHTLHIDKKGILWIGTFTEGLFEYNFEENVLRIYKNDKNDSNSISDNQVTAITEDSNGSLWIGTGSEGINKFDYSKKKFVRYGIKNGLTGYCSSILEDNNRFLWIGSNEGLYKFDPEKERAVLYKLNDDVSFYNYGPSSICVKDKDGTLYFGSKYGLIYFNPSEIKDNPYIPNIVLTDFQILNESVNPSPENPFLKKNITAAKDITLSYKDNVISFEFAALIYNNPSKNQYAYMMEGFDKDWVYCGTRRNVTYTNLDPGEYTFKVKGSNNDGLWNEEGASVKLIIIPPWWQTWWFKSCGAALIFLTAGFGYKKRVNKLRREKTAQEEFSRRLIESQEEERKRIASSLHDTIAHDILLTKSKALLALRNPDDNENLKNALNEISDMSSETINDVRGISYNLHPHQLERLGFSEAIESIINDVSRASHIEFSVKVDNVDDVISKEGEINLYRVIQEAINNIIKHSKATEAELKVVRLENQIIISISDNGIGLDSRKSSDEGKYGFGLSGIAERVKILKGEFKVESEENSGTVLRISVPIVNNPVEIK